MIGTIVCGAAALEYPEITGQMSARQRAEISRSRSEMHWLAFERKRLFVYRMGFNHGHLTLDI
jgi:hypothetical protein